MKSTKKTIIFVAVLAIMVMFSAAPAFAAGTGYSPYSPYNGHPPTDTALGGLTDLMIASGLVLYVAGLGIVVYASKVKAMINAR
ncbi:MAG: hypothetical protein QY318_00900 [Candidatus Dojkabacteria bacterium]|nr:MAG: hypothetical protein QY318_00900 [Candidatus Dojkabacteria bacterium]